MNKLPESDGIYYDIPGECYHEVHTRVNKGQLDIVHRRTPYEYCLGLSRPREISTAMRIGSLAHACILQPKEWDKKYSTFHPGDKRTKSYREEFSRFQSECDEQHLIAVASEESTLVCSMRDSLPLFQPKIKELIDNGKTEVTVLWTDGTTGVKCKCRPDCMIGPKDSTVILDLKTSDDISIEEWSKKIDSYRYHVQEAWYREGLRSNGITVAAWIWAIACKVNPYMWAMRSLPKQAVELGWSEAQSDLAIIARCQVENHWPSYPQRVEEVDLPLYAYKR